MRQPSKERDVVIPILFLLAVAGGVLLVGIQVMAWFE